MNIIMEMNTSQLAVQQQEETATNPNTGTM